MNYIESDRWFEYIKTLICKEDAVIGIRCIWIYVMSVVLHDWVVLE